MNELESYDRALAAAFAYIYRSRSVPVVFAAQQKAFSTLQHLYSEGSSQKKVGLPVMALSRIGFNYALDRFVFHNQVKVKYDSLPYPTNVYTSTMPEPWDITYQLDLWADTRTAANWLVKSVLAAFTGGYGLVKVDLGAWGNQRIQVKLDGFDDTSILEPGEDLARPLRHTFSMTLHGWVFGDNLGDAENPGKALVEYKSVNCIFACIKELKDDGTEGVVYEDWWEVCGAEDPSGP